MYCTNIHVYHITLLLYVSCTMYMYTYVVCEQGGRGGAGSVLLLCVCLPYSRLGDNAEEGARICGRPAGRQAQEEEKYMYTYIRVQFIYMF